MNIFTIIDKKITRHAMAVISGKMVVNPTRHVGYKRVTSKAKNGNIQWHSKFEK